jgi:hypothetical protein
MVVRGTNGCGLTTNVGELVVDGGASEKEGEVYGSGKLKNKDDPTGNLNASGKGSFLIVWYPEIQGDVLEDEITIILKNPKKHVHVPYTLENDKKTTVDPTLYY